MKLIMAIIRPHKLEEVKKALSEVGVSRHDVLPRCKGFGRTGRQDRGLSWLCLPVDFVPKIRLDLVVVKDQVRSILEALEREREDRQDRRRQMFVLNVEEAMRLRTGERGESAI